MKFLDNKTHGTVIQTIRENLASDSKLSVLSGAFSIWAYAELKKELQKVKNFRLLMSGEIDSHSLIGGDSDRRFRNKLNATAIAKECAHWLEKSAIIRRTKLPVPQSLIHFADKKDPVMAIQGSSCFDTEGLGISPSKAMHMNTCFEEAEQTKMLLEWFNSIWGNTKETADFKSQLLEELEKIYSVKSPQAIYFQVLYNIFNDFLGELDEENIIKTKTGIKDTLVWRKLYKFQKDGVLGAIDKIEKYNGCIIADSVGLGKTFEALAIIKYYELRNDRVLVLCPKKLRENWSIYTVNDKRNLFASDRFNFDVLNHTDLNRVSGMSGEINLETLNWSNYDLVVIDESHNFRNNTARKGSISRYSRLMNEIIRKGVETKILMLSATPVNSKMNDLKNQVAFITEGKDDALIRNGIYSIEQTLKNAQGRFNRWLKLDEAERTAETLLETLNLDYFKLLDLLTIARSRKHIEKYYDIKEVGEFPKRNKPINFKTDIDTEFSFPALKEINRQIRSLNLGAYSPLKYLFLAKREEYSRKYDVTVESGSVFKQVDREESLIHLMRVNLLKRMESSIHSFTKTLEKLIYTVSEMRKKINMPQTSEISELSIEDIDANDDEFSRFTVGNKIKVLIKDVDKVKWDQELEEDEEVLTQLFNSAKVVDAQRDIKLQKLRNGIAEKINNPINPNNRKVIVFTAFADTAKYLYENISEWAKSKFGLNSALVVGTGENKTNMPGIRKDLASIITSFSPVSKERKQIAPQLTDEIDILIATDCISEGQNLQDCDYLVNYDIHWNPVRIIQRFGRIDRLGSINDSIQLVNFWPNLELDEYINLEARVSGRMVLLDISATGEENVIDSSDNMKDLEYRRKQLEKLQQEVVDIEDLGGNISITDLTFNDFKMDLGEFLKENATILEKAYMGSFCSVVPEQFHAVALEPGAIFCLKNCKDPEARQGGIDASLGGHYLYYIADDGRVVFDSQHSKKILDILKKLGKGSPVPQKEGNEYFNQKTETAKDMSHYQDLLAKTIVSITGQDEVQGVKSLFQPGGTTITKDSFKGIDDFEVIAWFIVGKV